MSWRENRGGRGQSRGGRGRGGNYRGGGGYRGNSYNRPYNKRSRNQDGQESKRTKFEVTSRLKEVDLGVTEFIGDHEHFTGIMKERFSDFHVHEVGNDGVTAKLTCQDTPSDPLDTMKVDDMKKALPQEIVDKLETMSAENSEVNSIEIDVSDIDKNLRRHIHNIAKNIPSVTSQTVEKDDKKFMVIQKTNKPKQTSYKLHRDSRVDWENRGGPFCHFVLHKVNMDTMDTLNQLAYNLRIKTNMIGYAGTKDRRARTSQWVSLKRITPYAIMQASKRIQGAHTGNYKFAAEPLKLGMLKGNQFTIVLRNVLGADEEIDKALTSLRDKGFINYYGLQRFGTVAAIPTWMIGRALLKRNWQEAIELILKPRTGEPKDMATAREVYFKTKDANEALKHIHRFDKIEAKLLQGLQANGGKNPQGALDSIPRNTRLIYTHAYQSYVWNFMVSRRIREFGRVPVVGDLVYEKPDTVDEVVECLAPVEEENSKPVEGENSTEKTESNVKTDGQEPVDKKIQPEDEKMEAEPTVADEKGENSAEKAESDAKTDGQESVAEKTEANGKKIEAEPTVAVKNIPDKVKTDKNDDNDDLETNSRPLASVKVLTEQDLPNYTFADVVMPQPGHRITYPTYAKAWYEEFLSKDGLALDLRQKNRKYSLSGAYRKILQIPQSLTWKVLNYSDMDAELIRTDVDEMRGMEEVKNDPEGKHKALVLEMVLKPSTYATMALREILKHETSPEIQAAQSAAHHATQESKEESKEAKMDVEKTETKVVDKMEVAEEDAKKEQPMEAEPAAEATPEAPKPQ